MIECLSLSLSPSLLAPSQELLMDYFHLFGTKSCVFDDLKPYLDSKTMPPDIVQGFLDQVEQEINSNPLDFDCPPEQIRENVSYCLYMSYTV